MNSERSLRVTVDLSETYPTMEAQGPVPELLRKVLNAYDMVSNLHAQAFIPQVFWCVFVDKSEFGITRERVFCGMWMRTEV